MKYNDISNFHTILDSFKNGTSIKAWRIDYAQKSISIENNLKHGGMKRVEVKILDEFLIQIQGNTQVSHDLLNQVETILDKAFDVSMRRVIQQNINLTKF